MIRFDRRGHRAVGSRESPPTLEQQMDDMRAVLDEIGVEQSAALIGGIDAGLRAMYAATYPDRITSLVLMGVAVSAGAYLTPERREQILDMIENAWGRASSCPCSPPITSATGSSRSGGRASSAAARHPPWRARSWSSTLQVDLRPVLPAIKAPTLVIHRRDNQLVPLELGRETAELIPNARFLEVPGTNAYGWDDPDGPANDAIEEFLTGRPLRRRSDRVLATVLFTDICGSTDKASEVGDRAWRAMLDQHNTLIREQLGRWRGREIKTLGDGFVATFDGPARAVRCAHAIVEAVRGLGLEVRAGLHTGEVELLEADVGGIAVHIGARVNAVADAGEVLVSSTVKELVVGSDLRFTDRGPHDLRGVPGEWRLFSLEPTSPGAMAYA